MKYIRERELIVEYGIKMSDTGLCPGTSGNLSMLTIDEDGSGRRLIAISPSGIDYHKTKPEDIVIADFEGNIVDGFRRPSSELQLHTAFYKAKPDTGAVVHTHSLYCTTFAALEQPLRAVHFIMASSGSDEVKCAPYVLFGTKELGDAAVQYAGESNAVLLANHGIVCCGSDMAAAFGLAINMEYLAQLQYQAMCIGQPKIISREEMGNVIKQFGGYGQPKCS